MKIELVDHDSHTELRLTDRFDLTAHRLFRDAVIQAVGRAPKGIQVDLSGVKYIDSSALGMLLMLRELAQNAGKDVSLAGATGAVLRAIQFAKLERLFKLLD